MKTKNIIRGLLSENKMNIGVITNDLETFKKYKKGIINHNIFIIDNSASFAGLHFDMIIRSPEWREVKKEAIKEAYNLLIY